MERKVTELIKMNNMLSEGDGVVVGVSGGADSMCLLRILLSLREKYKLRLLVIHINHGIRGASADADEEYVKEYCIKHEIEFEAVHADIPKKASEEGLTEEEAGRKVRYDSFYSACKKYNYTKIAVAHNSDDNAETVLFNIARGSGISGLRGISPKRTDGGITIIRPLITCTRKEIEEYLKEKNIGYRTDETNLENDYSRNKIRNIILPILRENLNSAVSWHLNELSGQAAELEELVKELSGNEIKKMHDSGRLKYTESEGKVISISLDTEALTQMNGAVRKELIRSQLGYLAGGLKDIENIHILLIEGLSEKQVGRSLDLPYSIKASREYGTILLKKTGEEQGNGETLPPANEQGEFFLTPDKVPSEVLIGRGKKLVYSLIPYEKSLNIPKNDYTKFFDYDKMRNDICVRTRQQGDYLLIKGEDGELHKKSLKTWFVDNKIPREERDSIMVMAEGSHILWVIGFRGDDSYLVSNSTKTILKAEIINE